MEWRGLLLIRAVDPGFPSGGTNLLFWSFFLKTVDLWNWKKLGREEGLHVSSTLRSATGLSVHQTFTGHSLRRCLDTSDMLPGFCPRVSYSFVSSTDGNLKNTKSQSCTDQRYHIVDSFRGAVIIHVQLRPLCFRVVFRGINASFSQNVSKSEKYERNYFSNLPNLYHAIRKWVGQFQKITWIFQFFF